MTRQTPTSWVALIMACLQGAAVTSRRGAAAGAGTAAHHGALCRRLDAPVPLKVEQLVAVLQFVDALVPVAEQVVEVPKIILKDNPSANRSCQNRIQQHVSSRSLVIGSRPGQGSAASSSSRCPAVLVDADDGIQGSFRTFHRQKKVRGSLGR